MPLLLTPPSPILRDLAPTPNDTTYLLPFNVVKTVAA